MCSRIKKNNQFKSAKITHVKKKKMVNSTSENAFGEQGWCSGESARLPTTCRRFDSRTRRRMWVEFVVVCGLLLYSAPRGFSPGTPVFPFPLKSYIIMKSTCPNSNSILECTNITERVTKLLGATLLYFYFCLLMKVLHVSYLVYIFRLISSKRN